VVKDFIYESPYQKVGQLMGSAGLLVQHDAPAAQPGPARRREPAAGREVSSSSTRSIPSNTSSPTKPTPASSTTRSASAGWRRFCAASPSSISCLGLFGLSAYTAQSRTKEIGVRRVLGASVNSIAGLLSKDFLKLVAGCHCGGFPAGLVADASLGLGLCRIPHRGWQWWVFAAAGVASVGIALATVGYQAIKAPRPTP
jgi:hypothetical protein